VNSGALEGKQFLLNTDGSFMCTCKTGYSGDGFNCTGKIIGLNIVQIIILLVTPTALKTEGELRCSGRVSSSCSTSSIHQYIF
jgi:hypothetical protein